MPFYKFKNNDVHINTLKAHPEVKYFIYNRATFYNNIPNIPGSRVGPPGDPAPMDGTGIVQPGAARCW